MQYFRIDPFNTGVKEGLFSTDIAYVVLASDYDSDIAYDCESVSVIHFFDGNTVTEIDRTQS